MDNIRNHVKELAKRNHQSIPQVAENAGITKKALYDFLRGGDIKMSTFFSVCDSLGYSPVYVIRRGR